MMNTTAALDSVKSALHFGFYTPSTILAVAATVALLAATGRTRGLRSRTRALVTGLAGGAGFLVAGGFGIVTLNAAIVYRATAKGRRGLGSFLAGFTALSVAEVGAWLYLDHDARTGAKGAVTGHLVWIVAAVVAFVFLAIVAARTGSLAGTGAERGYHGKGPKSGEVPEADRDPQRDFTPEQRAEIIKNSNGRCVLPGCGAVHGAPGVSLEADHIHPWAWGGPTTVKNGQALCGPHNRQKGAKTMEQYMAWRKANPFKAC